jgi:nucleoside-diphosphate-sugar epimerase
MSKNPSTIAITGATGFVGSEVTKYFLDKGWHVVGLTRSPGTLEHKNLTYRKYDITKAVPSDTLEGVDYLLHTAYVKLSKASPEAVAINIKGAENLIKAAKKAHVGQLLFMSTMSAHEDAISAYGKQKLEIENLFLKESNTSVIRSGLIIGNGGIVKDMAQFMRTKHMVPLINGGNQPLQIVSINNLAEVIYLMCRKKLYGKFVVATPEVYSYKAFYEAIAKQLSVKVLYIPISYKVLETVFRVADTFRLPLGVGEDNLKGLKMLREMPSKDDLNKIGVSLYNLEAALNYSSLTKE